MQITERRQILTPFGNHPELSNKYYQRNREFNAENRGKTYPKIKRGPTDKHTPLTEKYTNQKG